MCDYTELVIMGSPRLAYTPIATHPSQSVNIEYLQDLKVGLASAGLWHDEDEPVAPQAWPPRWSTLLQGPAPAPCKEFTLRNGLRLGLRCGSETMQFLGYHDDAHPAWWGNNFSFVPPLYNDYPHRARRDQPGAHHIGDLTLRIQPASRAAIDPTDVSFLSTSRGGGNHAANVTLLNNSSPLFPRTPNRVFAASELMPALMASGQIDNRHPLGRGNLSIVRSWEEASDAAGGLVLRFTFAVPHEANDGVAIQGLGFSMISDNTWGGLNTTQVGLHAPPQIVVAHAAEHRSAAHPHGRPPT